MKHFNVRCDDDRSMPIGLCIVAYQIFPAQMRVQLQVLRNRGAAKVLPPPIIVLVTNSCPLDKISTQSHVDEGGFKFLVSGGFC